MSALLGSVASLAEQAAQEEAAARDLDISGRSTEALKRYKNVVAVLSQAEGLCPCWHSDMELIATHIREVEERIAYLESLEGGAAMVPCESYVEPKQLTLHKQQGARGATILGVTASLGAAAGLMVYGARGGVLAAFGAAHLATRDDSAGHLFRSVGASTAEAMERCSQRAVQKLQRIDILPLLMDLAEATFATRRALGDVNAAVNAAVCALVKGRTSEKAEELPADAPLFLGAAAEKKLREL